MMERGTGRDGEGRGGTLERKLEREEEREEEREREMFIIINNNMCTHAGGMIVLQ